MKSRQKNEETLKLSLELLKRIPKSRKITAKELHSQLLDVGFTRDIRTIQRQLKDLTNTFDIEVDDRSKPYGYRWLDNANGLNLPGLSEHESVLLTMAEQYLANVLPANILSSMSGFFEQARNNLYLRKHSKSSEWLKKVQLVETNQPLLPPQIKDKVFDIVSRALFQNKWLELQYKNSMGYQYRARVMPLGLAQQGSRLYLIVRFEGHDDERNLALHRISDATMSTIGFARPRNFNLERYVKDGRFGFGDGQKIKLSFKINKEAGLHLTESKLSVDQVVKEYKAHYAFIATVVDSEILDGWLRGFGPQVWDIKKQDV